MDNPLEITDVTSVQWNRLAQVETLPEGGSAAGPAVQIDPDILAEVQAQIEAELEAAQAGHAAVEQ